MLNNIIGEEASSSQSDDTLMLAYNSGDVRAFELLYRRYKTSLFTYFYKNTDDDARACELFQDVWMSIVQTRESYQGQGRFSVWLYTLAHQRLADHDRYLSTLNPSPKSAEPLVSGIAWPLQSQEITEYSRDRNLLAQAIQRLPAMQRDLLLMRQVWQLKLDEIASIMEKPTDLLNRRLRYANNKLRLMLRGAE